MYTGFMFLSRGYFTSLHLRLLFNVILLRAVDSYWQHSSAREEQLELWLWAAGLGYWSLVALRNRSIVFWVCSVTNTERNLSSYRSPRSLSTYNCVYVFISREDASPHPPRDTAEFKRVFLSSGLIWLEENNTLLSRISSCKFPCIE